MIAGILLGPSLLGLLAPSVQAALFPPASLGLLSVVSQIGLVLYMFVVGTHLQTSFIRQAFRGAMLISIAGIVAPFVLGAALASFLYADGRFFAPNVSRWQSMIYLGAAMSVTAFPVLARIIQERGIAGTALGTLALAAGATDDAIAWCLLGRRARQPQSATSTSLRIPRRRTRSSARSSSARCCRADALTRRAQPSRSSRSRRTVLVPLFFAYSGLVHASQPAVVGGAAVAVDRA